MNLILLGAPGAGKGTQAEVICSKLSIPAISTGNIIREALSKGTEMGIKAKPYIDEYKKPAKEGVCDSCGGELIQRKDDHPDTVLDRLRVYHEQTEPLKDYYSKAGLLRVVEGQEEVAQTTALTLKALED